MPINFKIVTQEDGTRAVAVFDGTSLVSADEAHPNFKRIVDLCVASLDSDVGVDAIADLFDVPATIERKFRRLGERVTVRGNEILFDGDPVAGPLQDQILDFLDNDEDFEPLVNFWHKLATNPLGDVREGLFTWIVGQTRDGRLTITPEGDIIGYKAYREGEAILRPDEGTVYISSRPARDGDLVNGIEVPAGEYAEHVPGDLVEMPRSVVLHEPSQSCGVGLHVGTYQYARSFGPVVMAVKFSPRDIVSLPDSSASWKLRVCRYEIIEIVDEPYSAPVYPYVDVVEPAVVAEDEPYSAPVYPGATVEPDVVFEDATTLAVGDRLVDEDGDEGSVQDAGGCLVLVYDNEALSDTWIDSDDVSDEPTDESGLFAQRIHGKGGPTSERAKGRGKNPNQDSLGRFANGRPGSQRDTSTGRFSG